jgi:lycopene beta-cyclase
MTPAFTQPSTSIRFPRTAESDFDLVILGAGCAGLSLALRLADIESYKGRVLLVDRRKAYEQDRTWCFFQPSDTNLVPPTLVDQQWSTGTVRGGGKMLHVPLESKPYMRVNAFDFYCLAFERLMKDDRFSIALGRLITDADIRRTKGDRLSIHIDGHDHLSRQIIDSRNDSLATTCKAQLWQVFMGIEIEAIQARFDPQAAVLMDFVELPEYPVSFFYELPKTTTQSLIEFTVFSKTCIDPEQLRSLLFEGVNKRLSGVSYRIIRIEKGIIPMGVESRPSKPSAWVRSGLGAGAARPSTGYAFLRIQQWARDCAHSIATGQTTIGTRSDPWITKRMDQLFLKVLIQSPISASLLFLELFEKAPTPALLRFLNDEGSLGDHLKVIRAMPSRPFLDVFFKCA